MRIHLLTRCLMQQQHLRSHAAPTEAFEFDDVKITPSCHTVK